ncbi:MAG: SseB family protein [Lachnospiraceae bacterium]|nr:SseB family protein [Lachnospiraceae bacterium]
MIYRKDGFRPFYKAFAVFMLKDRFRKQLQDFPGIERADCMLTFGFIDHDQGFTMDVLALGESSEDGFRFFDGNEGRHFFVRADALMNDEAWWLEDKQGDLRKRYESKLNALKAYDAPENLERTRSMAFLDDARNFQFVDDVLVTLMRNGFRPEPCWVRIFDVGEHWFMGRLLHEPDQDFGCRKGEPVAFFLHKNPDGRVECWADLNPGATLSEKDLEDGSLLRASVKIYGNEKTREHFIDVCEFLRDSFVWMPCKKAKMPENVVSLPGRKEDAREDEKGGTGGVIAGCGFTGELPLEIAQPCGNAVAEPVSEDLAGKCVTDETPKQLIPEVLQNGDRFYVPVFSDPSQLGKFGESHPAYKKHFLEAMSMAVALGSGISGIVVNAFTDPFVLDRELFELVAKLDSRVGR